jgi:Lysyl oxidase
MRWAMGLLALAACRFDGGGFLASDDAAQAVEAGAADAAAADAAARVDAIAADAAARPDARPGMPDLALVSDEIAPSLLVTSDTFAADACEIAEGCVGGVGTRHLLRFTAVTANLGVGDLALGPVPPPGISNDVYVWSPCHNHHHVPGFEDYALVGAGGVVKAGHKQSYCLRDDQQLRSDAPGPGYGCADQGISAGWADVYERQLPCQWIDITDVPPGIYTLRITVNPARQFVESDYDNDVLEVQVAL